MKAGADLAGEVTDQVKKGWNLMKKKGLPMLSRFAQSTRSKVTSLTKKENESSKQSKKSKKESKESKESKEESESSESDGGDDNDVAYLSAVSNKHTTAL